MNDFVFVAGPIEKPITGGEKFHRTVADFLNGKRQLRALITEKDFPRTGKIFRPLLYNLITLRKLWAYNNYTLIFPLRYSHGLLIFLFYVKMLRKVKIIGVVHHLYSLHHYTKWYDKTVFWLLEKLVINLSDALIVNSQSTKNDVLKFDVNQKVFIVYPGTDIKPLPQKSTVMPRQHEIDLIYVGTISRRKGLLYLLEAIYLLKDFSIKLNIVGDTNYENDYYTELCLYIDQHSLAKKVEFHGRLSTVELDKIFRRVDIFVLPSLWEGYGIAIIDAMKYGIPIVASNIGAIPEIVTDGVNGFLIPPANPNAIAQALRCLISDEKLRKMMIRENLKKAMRFPNWQQVAENFYKTLTKIIDKY